MNPYTIFTGLRAETSKASIISGGVLDVRDISSFLETKKSADRAHELEEMVSGELTDMIAAYRAYRTNTGTISATDDLLTRLRQLAS